MITEMLCNLIEWECCTNIGLCVNMKKVKKIGIGVNEDI